MKVYPDKNLDKKPSRYHQNLQEIAKISNYQPIPSIPALSDDFNFTFLAKDYDEVNPYLNKNSMRGSGQNKANNQNPSFLYEENPFDMPLVSRASPPLLKKQNKQKFKLPNINNPTPQPKQINRTSIKSTKRAHQQRLSSQQRSQNLSKNKSVTIATRIQTDDVSILQDASMSSLLKVQTKSLCRSLEAESLSRLKANKITNPQIDLLEKHKQFLIRHNLLSRGVSQLSRFDQLSPVKSIEPSRIDEEESTGSSSDDEYIKDSVPGPGSYSISHHSSFSKPSLGSTISQTRSKNFTFGSKQARFRPQKNTQLNDTSYLQKLLQLKQKQAERQQKILRLYKQPKKVVPFNCKQQPKSPPKQSISQNLISPFYYNPRNGIEQELIKKIQRNFKGSFGVAEKRFRTIYRKDPNLGPGSYSVDVTVQDDEPKAMAFYFMSKKSRFE